MAIYFLEGVGQCVVKIGHSKKDAAGRCSDIQRMCPVPLRIVFIQHSPGTQKDESELHNRFRKFRLWGEWFTFSDEIREYIDAQRSPGLRQEANETVLEQETLYFDPQTLPAYLQCLRRNNTQNIVKATQELCKKLHDLKLMHQGVLSSCQAMGKLIESQSLIVERDADCHTSKYFAEQNVMRAAACIDMATDAIRASANSYEYQKQAQQDRDDLLRYGGNVYCGRPRRRRRPRNYA
ncbi:MAG: GIY-YIG nuclease family protein [Planctomycetota bacterium]